MEEKYMVNDILNNAKNDIKLFSEILTNTEEIKLRTSIKDLRNSLEDFAYNLFKTAESKGYCNSIQKAKIEEINRLKEELNIEL